MDRLRLVNAYIIKNDLKANYTSEEVIGWGDSNMADKCNIEPETRLDLCGRI